MSDKLYDADVWASIWRDEQRNKKEGRPELTVEEMDDDDPVFAALAKLIYPCGDVATGDDPKFATKEGSLTLLREFLNVFDDHPDLAGYLKLEKQDAFARKWTGAVYHLLFNLMQKLGFVGHFGSVTSSGFLSDAGGGLKRCLNMPGFIDKSYPGEGTEKEMGR